RADHPEGSPELLQVGATATAAGEVLLEARALGRRQGALQVGGHQLDHLAAGHRRYSSSARRTAARARWRRTRWFAVEIPSSPAASSEPSPATSRSRIASRCRSGRAAIAALTCSSVSLPSSRDSGTPS